MQIIRILLISTLLYACGGSIQKEISPEQIDSAIESGEYTAATQMIWRYLSKDSITPLERYNMLFKLELMERIKKDFSANDSSVVAYIKRHHPNVTPQEIAKWEESNALENITIDGKKRYFNYAARNLFRIDKDAATFFEDPNSGQSDSLDRFLAWHIPELVKIAKKEKKILVDPVEYSIQYTLTVKPNEVPEGEIIRAWLPFPRSDIKEQGGVILTWVSDTSYIISPDSYPHKSIYMQAKAVKDMPTIFSYTAKFQTYAQVHLFDHSKIAPYNKETPLYKEFTAERAPHIVFSENIVKAVEEAIGNEQNPYLKVKLIYEWITQRYPWASAREYSTIPNIPEYVLANNHGDCGQVSLLFITMARYAGIPAKWQSGWMLHPGNKNLHDWAQVYYQGIGWVPVDQSFGLIKDNKEDLDSYYFFTRGLDSYRMIVNQDYSGDFFPAKIHPRSETVDFQRGEVEWRGENLYFGRWRYNLEIK